MSEITEVAEDLLDKNRAVRRAAIWFVGIMCTLLISAGYLTATFLIQWEQDQWRLNAAKELEQDTRLWTIDGKIATLGLTFLPRTEWEAQRARRDNELERLRQKLEELEDRLRERQTN